MTSGAIDDALDESCEMCLRLRKDRGAVSSIEGCGVLLSSSSSSGSSAVHPFLHKSSHVLHRHDELSSSKKWSPEKLS